MRHDKRSGNERKKNERKSRRKRTETLLKNVVGGTGAGMWITVTDKTGDRHTFYAENNN
jgi:hypothetical protein